MGLGRVDFGLDGLGLIARRIDSDYKRRRERRFDVFKDSKGTFVVNTTLTDMRRQAVHVRG